MPPGIGVYPTLPLRRGLHRGAARRSALRCARRRGGGGEAQDLRAAPRDDSELAAPQALFRRGASGSAARRPLRPLAAELAGPASRAALRARLTVCASGRARRFPGPGEYTVPAGRPAAFSFPQQAQRPLSAGERAGVPGPGAYEAPEGAGPAGPVFPKAARAGAFDREVRGARGGGG